MEEGSSDRGVRNPPPASIRRDIAAGSERIDDAPMRERSGQKPRPSSGLMMKPLQQRTRNRNQTIETTPVNRFNNYRAA
jgi:hypothetical protein